MVTKISSKFDEDRNKILITHFLPSIGTTYIASQQLKKKFNIEDKYFISFEELKERDNNFVFNYPDIPLMYFNLHEVKEDMEGLHNDFSLYKKYIKQNNIKPTDIMIATTPCKGLSSISRNYGVLNPNNIWMFVTIKWFMAQQCKFLIFEGSDLLSGKLGLKLYKSFDDILGFTKKGYKIHVIKTTSMKHGLPQNRVRSFVLMYKGDFNIFTKWERDFINFKDFFNRPEEFDESIQHVNIFRNEYWKEWENLFKENKKFFDYCKKNITNDTVKRTMPYLLAMWDNGEVDLEKYPLILKAAHIKRDKYNKTIKEKKLKKNGIYYNYGYFDMSPIMPTDFSKALNPRTMLSTFHPKYIRYLTVREVMDIQGLPDSFKLQNLGDWRDISRCITVNTAHDILEKVCNIIFGTNKDYISYNSNNEVIVQNNTIDGFPSYEFKNFDIDKSSRIK